MGISTALLAPFISTAATLLLCIYAMPICRRLNILDLPDERKRHAQPTPLMGGIVLQGAVVPVVVSMALLGPSTEWTRHLLVWAAALVTMTLVGLADDRHTLSARDRLLISFLVFGSAAIIDPQFNVRVLSFEYPEFQLGLGTGWLAVIFTTICCVGLVNAVNMADGKNGLVIGLCLGWLGLLTIRSPSPLLPLIVALVGPLAVLLIFNLKGRLFLGDGGAYGLATGIGLLSIIAYNNVGVHAGRRVAADELMVLFALPVLDSFRLTFARWRRGQPLMGADREHLHHHLDDRLGWPAGLVVYLTAALAPAAVLFYAS